MKAKPSFKILNDLSLLNDMVKDMKSKLDVHKPGPYWIRYTDRTTKALRERGIENFRGDPALGKGFADVLLGDPFDPPVPPGNTKSWILACLLKLTPWMKIFQRIYKERFRIINSMLLDHRNKFFGIALKDLTKNFPAPVDPLLGNPTDLVLLDNQTIGIRYIRSMLRLQAFFSKVDLTNVKVFFEIGGGFGASTHLFIEKFPNVRTILYLDIPPILYIGTQYLKALYPNNVVDYRQMEKLDSVDLNAGPDEELRIFAIAPWQLSKVKGFVDCVYNSESFIEMPEKTVEFYVKEIERRTQKSDAKILVSFYKFDPKQGVHSPEKIKELLEKMNSFNFEFVESSFKTQDDERYLLGKKK